MYVLMRQQNKKFHATYVVGEPCGQKRNPQRNIGDCNKRIHTRAASVSARFVKAIVQCFFFFSEAIMPWRTRGILHSKDVAAS